MKAGIIVCLLTLWSAHAEVARAQGDASATGASELLERAKRQLFNYQLKRSAQLLESLLTSFDPNHREAGLLLARIDAELGRFDDALARCRALLAKQADDALVASVMADVLNQADEPDQALKVVAPVLANRPEFAPALRAKAVALHLQGDLVQARAILERVLAANPDDHVACYHVARHAQEARRLPEAIAYYDRCIKLQNQRGRDALIGVPACAYLGEVLLDSGQFAPAITYLEQVVRLDPQRPRLHFLLGLAHSMMSHYEVAGDHLQKAIAEDGLNVVARARLAFVLMAQNQNEAAIEQLRTATAVDPKYAFAYAQLGTLLLKLGRTDEARAALAKAVEVAPEFAPGTFAYAQLCAEEDDHAQAAKWFEATLKIDPLHVQAYYLLAQALRKTGRPEARPRAEEASAIFEQLQPHQRDIDRAKSIVNTSPGAAESRALLAARLFDIGNYAAALDHLNVVLSANPASVEALKQRARVYEATSKRELARTDWQAASRLRADDDEIKAGLERVK